MAGQQMDVSTKLWHFTVGKASRITSRVPYAKQVHFSSR